MATELQKRALDKMVEKGRNGKKISVSATMREVGYSEVTATHPDKLTKSQGFIELCDELGLTDSFLTKALVADIKAKPKKREKELRLAFQVRGRLKENEEKGTTNNIFINNLTVEQRQRVARRIISRSKGDAGVSNGVHGGDEHSI